MDASFRSLNPQSLIDPQPWSPSITIHLSPIAAIGRLAMTHDIPDFKTSLRLALAETDTGPAPETLLKAPILDHWFGVSQNGFPSLMGRTRKIDAPSHANPIWKRTSVVLGLDKNGTWARTLNCFYQLSDETYPSIPDFEKGFGKLILQGLQPVSQDEFAELVDGFAGRARWCLRQIN